MYHSKKFKNVYLKIFNMYVYIKKYFIYIQNFSMRMKIIYTKNIFEDS